MNKMFVTLSTDLLMLLGDCTDIFGGATILDDWPGAGEREGDALSVFGDPAWLNNSLNMKQYRNKSSHKRITTVS